MKIVNSIMTLIIALIFLNFQPIANAAPIWNYPISLSQPNGTIINCFTSGDEFYNWAHDADGYTIIQNSIGWYCYAVQSGDTLIASSNIVGSISPKTLGISPWLKISPDIIKARAQAYWSSVPPKPVISNTQKKKGNSALSLNTGTYNNIVIYIRFAGENEFTDSSVAIDRMFNATTGNSMKSYYTEASYSKLAVNTTFYPTSTTGIVVSYQDTALRSYYQPYSATNTNGYTSSQRTTREHALLKRAVDYVSSQIPSTINIDNDNDGYVDNVCFIVSGTVGGWNDLLWPHMWSLYSNYTYINSKRVYTYNFQLKDYMISSGVGVLCHEMFHSLGAPDLYHYSYDGLTPIGKWDIMEYDLNPPQHMGAYMKYKYGDWLDSIPTITKSGLYTLKPLATGAYAYKIKSTDTATEFYVLEYRRKLGTFESSLPGSGLIITRINTKASGNSGGPPDEIYAYRPDGTISSDGTPLYANYSSTAGRTAINVLTTPSPFLSNGTTDGGLKISQIGAVDTTISFYVDMPDVNLTKYTFAKTSGTYTNISSPTTLALSGDNKTKSLKLPFKFKYHSVLYDTISVCTNGWIALGTTTDTIITNKIKTANARICPIWDDFQVDTSGQFRYATTGTAPYRVFTLEASYLKLFQYTSKVSFHVNLYENNNTIEFVYGPMSLVNTDAFTATIGISGRFGGTKNFISIYNTTTPTAKDSLFNDTLGRASISKLTIGTTYKFTPIDAIFPPALASPINVSTNIAIAPTLAWNASTNATTYTIQIASDTAFSNILYSYSQSARTKALSGLAYNSKYFWRVRAYSATDSSNWSSVWSLTTRDGTPAIPNLASPINLSTNIVQAPTLSWSASNYATYYSLQVSTDSTFASTLYNQNNLTSLSFDISGLSYSTVYYWRVKALNAIDSSDYSSIWRFTVRDPQPAIPTLSSPAALSTNIALAPTLTWNAAVYATNYSLQISTDTNFTTLISNQSNISSLSASISALSYSTTYYWRLRAFNSSDSSDYSSIWSFTTRAATPAAPLLALPSSGSLNTLLSLNLTWLASLNATNYSLEISTSSTFSVVLFNYTNLTSTTYPLSGLSYSTKYYWRVKALNASDSSIWSNAWNFTTRDATPAIPVLSSPLSATTNIALAPILSWNASNYATKYALQVSLSPTFSTLIYNQSNITTLSSSLIGLSYSTVYYWRVKAKNASDSSDWSSVWNFTSRDATPAAPTLSAPISASTNIAIAPTLSWSAALYATDYTLQVADDSSFATVLYNQANLTSNSFALSGLSYSTKYFWRVKAKNASDSSAWSSIWSFVSRDATPAIPALASPNINAVNIALTTKLNWNPSASATNYDLQISTDSLFATQFVSQSQIDSISFDISGLAYSTKYFWRVKAKNASDSSDYSPIWNFTTRDIKPAVPSLISPINASTVLALSTALSWNSAANATNYTLQVSNDSLFSATIVNQTNIASLSYLVNSLSYGAKYYWRVKAFNASDSSDYSNVWNFTVRDSTPSVPTPTYPSNLATAVTVNTSLFWNQSNFATNYKVQVSLDSLFSSIYYEKANIQNLYSILLGLQNLTKYYWRVKAYNAFDSSAFSSVWAFTTEPIYRAPTLTTDSINMILAHSARIHGTITNDNYSPIVERGFIWSTSAQLSLTNNSGKYIVDTTNGSFINSYYADITQLSADSIYYFRAYATNGIGTTYGTVISIMTLPDLFTISGTVSYPKYTVSPYNSKILLIDTNFKALPKAPWAKLYNSIGAMVDSVLVDSLTGSFVFHNIQDGVYHLALDSNMPWTSNKGYQLSLVDYKYVKSYVVGLTYFDSLQMRAANIDRSGNGVNKASITLTDAANIMQRIVGISTLATWNLCNYLYALETVPANPNIPRAALLNLNMTIVISGASKTDIKIRCLSAGDVDGQR